MMDGKRMQKEDYEYFLALENAREFKRALSGVLNEYGVDNFCDTPDFILADMLVSHLEAASKCVMHRDKWLDRPTAGEQIAKTTAAL